MSPVKPVLPGTRVLPAGLASVTFGGNQPEYLPLPTVRSEGESECVTSRWKLGWKERLRVLFGGNIWLQQLMFGRRLQPVKMLAFEPNAADCF